jgi:hypothetical protein
VGLWSHSNYYCAWYKVQVDLHLLFSICPPSYCSNYLWKSLFSNWVALCLCQKSNDCLSVVLFPGILFYFMMYPSVCRLVLYYIGYQSFKVHHKLRQCKFSSNVLSKDCFDESRSIAFPKKPIKPNVIFDKKTFCWDRIWVLRNIGNFGLDGHLNNIEHMHYI